MTPIRLAQVARWSFRWRIVLPLVALLFGLCLSLLHPWLITWGATAEEQAMTLPGDATDPPPYLTRSINIDAPPSAVWPWIVQMGQDRAGFYSNTWLENLFGSDIHNAESLHPEWQQRTIGDRVPLARPDLLFGLGAVGHTNIVVLAPERTIGIIVGRFVLQPVGDDRTRLVFRESAQTQGAGAQGSAAVRVLIWDPAHFVMVHRVLEGIKERAEARPLVPLGVQVPARLGWLLAGAALVAVFAAHRRWWPWLALLVLMLVPPYLATGDLDSTLAGVLALGIPLAGGLAFGRRWWPAYVLIASFVLLVLLLAPDAYAAFGLIFFVLAAGLGRGCGVSHADRRDSTRSRRPLRRSHLTEGTHMSNWILVALLGLEAHFAASYVVPLDTQGQGALGGLLRWFWPWAYGDGGPLGRITPAAGFPVAGFFLAAATFLFFLLGALAAAGIWVPSTWWPLLATIGAVLLLCLMVSFFGPTKLIPIAFALATLFFAVSRPTAFAVG